MWKKIPFLVASTIWSQSLLMTGAGVFNVVKGTMYPQIQLEYRGNTEIYRRTSFWIRPLVAGFINSKASTYFCGGLAFDIFLGKRMVFTPTFAPGVYFKGKGKDMGYPLEFRSSVELSYLFPENDRLGVQFYHLSNGTFGDQNPGTECLMIFYGVDF